LLKNIQTQFFAHVELDEHQNGAAKWRRDLGWLRNGHWIHAQYFIPAEESPAEKKQRYFIVAGGVTGDERAAASNPLDSHGKMETVIVVYSLLLTRENMAP
jgi:hypothetical protein